MRPFRAATLCAIALTGGPVTPQERPTAAEDKLLVFPSYLPPQMLHLEGGVFRLDFRSVGKKSPFEFVFRGRDYRMLSKQELAQLDAMPRIEVRRGRLYYDGRRIKTNSLWVHEVHAARHWNGGVALAARTSKGDFSFPEAMNEAGFLDPRAGTCRFSRLLSRWGKRPDPDILAPVTIDESDRGLGLDVAVPGSLSLSDVTDMTVSLTNRSGAPVALPDSLAEGLGVLRVRFSEGEMRGGGPEKLPEHPPAQARSPLPPGGTRGLALTLNARDVFHEPGRHRLTFYWDGFLDPGDRERMTRLACERWVDVTEPAPRDTKCGDLALAALVQEKVPKDGIFEFTVTLTNTSGRAVLVPDSLGDGVGITWTTPWAVNRRTGARNGIETTRMMEEALSSKKYLVDYNTTWKKHPAIRLPYRDACSPLAPGASREARVSLDPRRMYLWPGRHRCVIHWDGLLDPDDREHVTRLSTGEFVVEVTE